MSTINTNGIDVNYPVPGVNNNSQGFRDNFASIKNNLNVAASEISDLQNKVVVKSALANTTVNNDMANTLISNALTRSFRASTYNLGNALSGTVVVNASLGDVQIGTVAANSNITLEFSNWAPAGTQSNVQLLLTVNDSNSYVDFTGTNVDESLLTIQNYSANKISAPYGVSQLDFRLSTIDCGNTITIEPYYSSRDTEQIQLRSPIPTGFQGDTPGAVSVDSGVNQLTISTTNSADYFVTTDTSQLYTDMPVVFTGTSFEANITAGTTYYVRNVVSSTQFTVSSTLGGANVNLAGSSGTMYANPVRYIYVCTDDYNSTAYAKTATNTNTSGNVTLNNTTSLVTNAPIIFTGTTFGGITANTTYYVKSIGTGGNITISRSRTNGVADTVLTLTTATGSCTATAYIGSDIWKRIQLNPW